MTSWMTLLGWTLLHFLWQGTIVALVAAAVLRAQRRSTAQWRYATACAALLLMLAAPLVTLATLTASTEVAATPVIRRADTSTSARGSAMNGELVEPGSVADARVDAAPADPAIPGERLALLVGLWFFGVLMLSGRLLLDGWRTQALLREVRTLPPSPWSGAALRLARRLGLGAAIRVVEHVGVRTPSVIGLWQPVLLLPVASFAELTPAQVEAILAHELAHVRRHDFLVNLLQLGVETLLFYHPAVWWVSRRVRDEREHCCDDVAVSVCGDAIGYAEALTVLAAWGAAPALAMGATDGRLLSRVRRIVGEPLPAARPAVALAMVLAVVASSVVGIAALQSAAAQGGGRSTSERTADRWLPGPMAVNDYLGFDLLPRVGRFWLDDPRRGAAWDVVIASPSGDVPFIGFTGRTLVRRAFELGDTPLVDIPAWMDDGPVSLRVAVPAASMDDSVLWRAVRDELERRFGVAVSRSTREEQVYALARAGDPGGMRRSTLDCTRLPRLGAPMVRRELRSAREAPGCGVDLGPTGITAWSATTGEFARSLDGFLDRHVVDRTGMTGAWDFRVGVGFTPLSAVAFAHPLVAGALAPFGVRPLPQAIEEQLGLRLVPSTATRDVFVVSADRVLADRAGAVAAR